MVASSQPEATNAGLHILRSGGNAADAAVAVAAALQVTQPCSTGLGGDCFSLYYDSSEKTVYALNGSGKSPADLTMDLIIRHGFQSDIPAYHPFTVTVPGAPAGWADTVERFGTLDLAVILSPAIDLAEKGFPVAPITAGMWSAGAERQLSLYAHGSELTVEGRAPNPGEVFKNPGLANVLKTLAEDGPGPFYRGWIAERIAAAVQREGGVMREADLAGHESKWVEPISTDYRGTRMWECPPNGQGIAALIALNIIEQFDIEHSNPVDRFHLMIEAMHLAFADAGAYVADPDTDPAPIDDLLSKDYSMQRAALIDPASATVSPGTGGLDSRAGTDTVYFATADRYGNGCSFINSNYMGFGTGIVPEGCGYSLQNRGKGFSLTPGHPNQLGPEKRPYHTIIPGMATDPIAGDLKWVFGVMGGFMQPQGHLQVASHLVDDGHDPQGALDAPRFFITGAFNGGKILLEKHDDEEVVSELIRRGHDIAVAEGGGRVGMGLGQVIVNYGPGICCGGSDPRGDGLALGE
jgi:gamma-glutamyltranspeptidase/glutathione hydrolase